MIYVEILLYLVIVVTAIYVLFFSKRFQNFIKRAEQRNRELNDTSLNTADGIKNRVDDLSEQQKKATEAVEARRRAIADEQAKLDNIK